MKILLDANFLLIPFQFKVDIFSEIERIVDVNYELVTLKSCLNELKSLKEYKPMLKLAKEKNIKIIENINKPVDKEIIKYAVENQALVATQDKELKRKLKKEGINTITLRKKKFLVKIGT